jgi:hypothetical protein
MSKGKKIAQGFWIKNQIVVARPKRFELLTHGGGPPAHHSAWRIITKTKPPIPSSIARCDEKHCGAVRAKPKTTQQGLAALSLRSGDEQRRTKAGKGSAAGGRKSLQCINELLLSTPFEEM